MSSAAARFASSNESTVALSGWRLSGAVDFAFPAGTSIEPGGFLVVAEDPPTVSSKWEVSALGPWIGKLDNDGETIRLRDQGGEVVDEVDYRLGFPWPTVGAPPSYSIELINPSLENDLGGSWRASTGGDGRGESTLIGGGSSWKFFKGTWEPSATPGAWREIEFDDARWAAGEGAMFKSSLYSGIDAGDVRSEVDSAVADLRKADPHLSKAAAEAKLFDERPDLYERYEQERQAAIRRAQS